MNKYWVLMFTSVIIASLSQVLLKKSAKRTYDTFIKEYMNPYVVVGYVMMVFSTVLTILAFQGLEYKNGPIIESLGYILIMFLSLFFFQEKITVRKVIGNLLILIGIMIFYL